MAALQELRDELTRPCDPGGLNLDVALFGGRGFG